MFSIHAACAVIKSYGIGDNAMIEILKTLKAAGKLRSDGYVMQGDLDKLIQEYAL